MNGFRSITPKQAARKLKAKTSRLDKDYRPVAASYDGVSRICSMQPSLRCRFEVEGDFPKDELCIRIVLPLPPNRGNARWHWRTEAELKKRYQGLCANLLVVRKYFLKPPTQDRRPWSGQVGIAASVHSCESDTDNRMARVKWPLDFLKRQQYFLDDSDKFLLWRDVPTLVPTSGKVDLSSTDVQHFLGNVPRIEFLLFYAPPFDS